MKILGDTDTGHIFYNSKKKLFSFENEMCIVTLGWKIPIINPSCGNNDTHIYIGQKGR
jgi:hypothetical protein